MEVIQNQLRKNKKDAPSRGGKSFSSKNIALKDENGKFIGSKAKEENFILR